MSYLKIWLSLVPNDICLTDEILAAAAPNLYHFQSTHFKDDPIKEKLLHGLITWQPNNNSKHIYHSQK